MLLVGQVSVKLWVKRPRRFFAGVQGGDSGRLSNVARPKAFDAVGYAMMSCANLLAGVERLERYLLILSDALTLHLHHVSAPFRCPVAFDAKGN